jgi:hypothetical protein
MDWTSNNNYCLKRTGEIDGRREVVYSIVATAIFLAAVVVLTIGIAAGMTPGVGTDASAETFDRGGNAD